MTSTDERNTVTETPPAEAEQPAAALLDERDLAFTKPAEILNYFDAKSRAQRVVAIVPSGQTRPSTDLNGRPRQVPVAKLVITFGVPALNDTFDFHVEANILVGHARLASRMAAPFLGQLIMIGDIADMRELEPEFHNRVKERISELNHSGQLTPTLVPFKALLDQQQQPPAGQPDWSDGQPGEPF